MIGLRWPLWATGILLASTFGCQKGSTSDLNVYNGTATSEYSSTVVRLLVDEARRRFCTGVVVDASTVLMAGHCIKNSSVQTSISVRTSDGKDLKASRHYAWASVRNMELLTDAAAARDLAVLVFEGKPFKGPFMTLAAQTVDKKNLPRVTIVGYGASDFSANASVKESSGLQRGSNKILRAENGIFVVKASLQSSSVSGENAAATAGDAGGPLLNQSGQLIGIGAGIRLVKSDGVTSTGVMEDKQKYAAPKTDDAAYVENSFVDLSSTESMKLLRHVISVEKDLKNEMKISLLNSQTGAIEELSGRKEPEFTKDDAQWMKDNNQERMGSWIAMSGRLAAKAALTSDEAIENSENSASLALLESVATACVNGVCQTNRGANSASASMGGGAPSNVFGPGMTQPFAPFGQQGNPFGQQGNPFGAPPAQANWGQAAQPSPGGWSQASQAVPGGWSQASASPGGWSQASASPGGWSQAGYPSMPQSMGASNMFMGGDPFFNNDPFFRDFFNRNSQQMMGPMGFFGP
jgi:hypothetical protein